MRIDVSIPLPRSPGFDGILRLRSCIDCKINAVQRESNRNSIIRNEGDSLVQDRKTLQFLFEGKIRKVSRRIAIILEFKRGTSESCLYFKVASNDDPFPRATYANVMARFSSWSTVYKTKP